MKQWKIASLAIITCVLLGACFPNPPMPTSTAVPSSTPSPTSTPIVTDVKISDPENGAKIDQTWMVKGTSQNVPAGSVIWIVIYLPSVRRYYPQDLPADLQVNHDWSSTVSIGQVGDSGLGADILVVLADKNTQDAFNIYLQDAKGKNDYPGLEKLPDQAQIYDRISVTRK